MSFSQSCQTHRSLRLPPGAASDLEGAIFAIAEICPDVSEDRQGVRQLVAQPLLAVVVIIALDGCCPIETVADKMAARPPFEDINAFIRNPCNPAEMNIGRQPYNFNPLILMFVIILNELVVNKQNHSAHITRFKPRFKNQG